MSALRNKFGGLPLPLGEREQTELVAKARVERKLRL
jgi:hypothetical protein